jgi:hypothetical protein
VAQAVGAIGVDPPEPVSVGDRIEYAEEEREGIGERPDEVEDRELVAHRRYRSSNTPESAAISASDTREERVPPGTLLIWTAYD